MMKSKPAFSLDDAGLCLAVARVRCDGAADFRRWCAAGLAQLRQEDWLCILSDDRDELDLLLLLREYRTGVKVGPAFQDALAAHAEAAGAEPRSDD